MLNSASGIAALYCYFKADSEIDLAKQVNNFVSDHTKEEVDTTFRAFSESSLSSLKSLKGLNRSSLLSVELALFQSQVTWLTTSNKQLEKKITDLQAKQDNLEERALAANQIAQLNSQTIENVQRVNEISASEITMIAIGAITWLLWALRSKR